MHAPLAHTAPVPQAKPQPPQLAASVMVLTQAPLHASPPPGQPHTPALHASPVPHATLHPPQWMVLVMVLTQAPPQLAWGAVHVRPPVVLVPPVVVVEGLVVLVVVLGLVVLGLVVLAPGVAPSFDPEQPHTMAKTSVTSATRVVLCFIRVSSAKSVF